MKKIIIYNIFFFNFLYNFRNNNWKFHFKNKLDCIYLSCDRNLIIIFLHQTVK